MISEAYTTILIGAFAAFTVFVRNLMDGDRAAVVRLGCFNQLLENRPESSSPPAHIFIREEHIVFIPVNPKAFGDR